VGDLAQSTGAWSRDTWDDVSATLRDQCPEQVEELALGYRVPQQVFELAAQLLPYAAPAVQAPTVVRRGPADPDLREVDVDDVAEATVQAAKEHAANGLFVGIVCADGNRDTVVAALDAAKVSFKDARSGSLGTSINLVDPNEAKGLEFEAVVVVEPESIVAENDQGLRLLYVALTRTTKYLTVVHSGRVLPLPGVDDLDALPSLDMTSLEEMSETQGHAPAAPMTAPGPAGSEPANDSRPAPRPIVGGLPPLPGLHIEGELDLEPDPEADAQPPAEAAAPAVALPPLPPSSVEPSASPTPRPESPAPVNSLTPPLTSGPLDDLSAVLAHAMAVRLAEHVATAAQPALWSAIVDALRDELDHRREL
jgi:hypothetical protein